MTTEQNAPTESNLVAHLRMTDTGPGVFALDDEGRRVYHFGNGPGDRHAGNIAQCDICAVHPDSPGGVSGRVPDPGCHDSQCEAEFVGPAGAYTACDCASRPIDLDGMRAPTDGESPDAVYNADVFELRSRVDALVAEVERLREENRQQVHDLDEADAKRQAVLDLKPVRVEKIDPNLPGVYIEESHLRLWDVRAALGVTG
jgi:hypothetical protein